MPGQKKPDSELIYDVLIIGSGVVGSAIAREMARYKLRIGVLEKELDVCCETSGRNSGVLHAGFNNKPGTLMAKFCVEGCLAFDQTARELDIPFRRTGKLVVGFDDHDRTGLDALKNQGDANGVPGLEIVGRETVSRLAPSIRGDFALYSPMTGILNPFLYTIALAENAYQNGVEFFFDHEVTGLRKQNGIFYVQSSQGIFLTRRVINCAGLFADQIARMAGISDYTIYPCRGEYFVLDKKMGPLLPLPAYPVPNTRAGGLGIHLTPTVDGNILVGPSTSYIDEKTDYATTRMIMDELIADGKKLFPALNEADIITSFSGVRPKLVSKEQGGYADFVIEQRPDIPGFINLVGIESPGLTSSMPIARYVIEMIAQDEDLLPNMFFNPQRQGITCFREQTAERQIELLQENPDYGKIVCRCENITQAEVIAAINNPLGVSTLAGIKNRSRAMMGRCQGGYCQIRITELIMSQKQKQAADVILSRRQSHMFTGEVRPS